MRSSFYSLLFVIFIFTNACTTTTAFHHPSPLENKAYKGKQYVGEVALLKDERAGDKSIDKIFKDSPLMEIQKMIEEEILYSGIFSQMKKKGETFNAELRYLIKPVLKRLEWHIPNYDSMVGTAFIVSALTGGIGGVIYGSTDTTVFGYVDLEIELYDNQSRQTVFNKTYKGEVKKTMAKIFSDSQNTKAEMIGLATQDAVKKFKVDLISGL
jgi:hypothetical protein